MASVDKVDLERLKTLVQSKEPATTFEHLVAGLIGELIGTSVAVAKSGFQHGADAGTVGRQQRVLRIECKRYLDTTTLSERELLGEQVQAFDADSALEAWVLAATREVPEQLEAGLFKQGVEHGVPVLVIDWKAHETPSLAALLASNPALVASMVGKEAGNLAASLQPGLAPQIARLRRDLAAWQIGFESLRRLAWQRIDAIWRDPRQSQSLFGQVVSGGSKPHIHRVGVRRELDQWWDAPPKIGSPICVTGLFGVGKTWSVTEWLIEHKDVLPIALLIPASAVPGTSLGSAYAVKRFLAQRLQELTKVRDVEHWHARLDRLLLRPESEGCVLTVVLDGMNQQAGVDWVGLLKILQGPEFVGRIRVITTTRANHFEARLQRMAVLLDRAVRINVDVYNDAPGGELEQMLALHHLSRSDLHPDLLSVAQNPRLFNLVIRFRDRLVDSGAVTPHRLLWEYGRDTAGESVSKAFSEQDWEDWLRSTAENFRNGICRYTLKDLSAMAARPDLEAREVYQRLSEIVDSQFVQRRPDGTMQLSPIMVDHALGATVVFLLTSSANADRHALETTLAQWLDPISGLDQRAEILRAAVSIALESGAPSHILGVLSAAWMQTQNLPQSHVGEVHALARELPEALLDVIELSHRSTHAASQRVAIDALRAVDRDDLLVRQLVLSRAADWLRIVSRDIEVHAAPDPEVERRRHERLIARVGRDESGLLTVLGERIFFVDRDEAMWAEHVSALIEGYPLADAMPALRIAAIAASIAFNHQAWCQLRWVCLLNEVDPDALAVAARSVAADMRAVVTEPGIDPHLKVRVEQLLLHLSGRREDNEAAMALDVRLDRQFTYEADYLPDPVRSFFPLERRHAEAALKDATVSLRSRLHRCADLCIDPTFEPPESFCDELSKAVESIAVDALYASRATAIQDHEFEQLQPMLARWAPRQLASLRRRWASSVDKTHPEARPVRAWHMNEGLLLYGSFEVAAAKALRQAGREERDGDEIHAGAELILPELKGMDALAQALAVVGADLVQITTSVTNFVTPLSTEQVDKLLERFGEGTEKQRRDVLILLVTDPPAFSDIAWAWVETFTVSDDPIDRRLGLMALAAADAKRLGHLLDGQGWRFSDGMDVMAAHAASGALYTATIGQPFDQVAARLAPWRLLEAVRFRGDDAAESRIAGELLDAVLGAGPVSAPDPGAQLTVRRETHSTEPPWLSVTPTQPTNQLEAMRVAFDTEAQAEEQERAGETALARVAQARQQGASLFLSFVTVDDAKSLLRHAPEIVHRWIEGHEELTLDFRRRVPLAEGLYVAVCEALLETAPAKGVSLWRALRYALRTRIMGAAKIPDLLHMLFRVPDSPPVLAARECLLSLEVSNTDADLYELALAASLNRRDDWLEEMIARDSGSDLPWRQQRASTFAGFRSNNRLPVAEAWPEGRSTSWAQDVSRRSERLRYLDACARHWWKEYWSREDLDEAYAAWVLFCQCADRRALVWITDEADLSPNSEDLKSAKRLHWQANPIRWKQGADRSGLNLQRNFLNRGVEDRVWPWRE
ncbi:hypothetical protein J2X04_001709 [Lysobacter niabensis]|uniref:Restriction endonuclease n=1 Tax=Agrilutibacter niabensis TaxID=380628 RepID=A0ABU1VPI1_9GAMM|nr:hypothetical protein [Lysobacter niabensis]MDR7099362.1 hypothetical protein [Lysobacter niabensis]